MQTISSHSAANGPAETVVEVTRQARVERAPGLRIDRHRCQTLVQGRGLRVRDVARHPPDTTRVEADAKLTLQALLAALKNCSMDAANKRGADVSDKIAKTRKAWLDEWMPKLTSDENPMTPYRVIWEMNQLVDKDNTIITHDAGSPRDQISPFWESTKPLSYIGWGKTTQLGYGLGLAMGAKLARPEALCINVWGDAAIGFTGMDFETAVRVRLLHGSIRAWLEWSPGFTERCVGEPVDRDD